MADDHADEAERDRDHHDKGLQVRTEKRGQDQVDNQQADGKQHEQRLHAGAHFTRRSFEPQANARKAQADVRELPRDLVQDHPRGGADVFVDFRGDRDRAAAVGARDLFQAPSSRIRRDFRQRHPAAPRRMDAQRLEDRQAAAVLLREPRHDIHTLAALLHHAGFDAVVRRAHLAGKIRHGQARRAARGIQAQAQFLLAGAVGVFDLADAFKGGQPRPDFCHGRAQRSHVFAGDFDLDVVAARPAAQRHHRRVRQVGHGRGEGAQFSHDLVAGTLAVVRLGQFDDDLPAMPADVKLHGARHADLELQTYGRVVAFDFAALDAELFQLALDLLQGRFGLGRGRAHGRLRHQDQAVGVDAVNQNERQAFSRRGEHDDQYATHQGHRHVTPFDGQPQRLAVAGI